MSFPLYIWKSYIKMNQYILNNKSWYYKNPALIKKTHIWGAR